MLGVYHHYQAEFIIPQNWGIREEQSRVWSLELWALSRYSFRFLGLFPSTFLILTF